MELVPCPQCGSFNDASEGTCKDCHAPLPEEPESPLAIALVAPEPPAPPPAPEAPPAVPAADVRPTPFDAPPDVLAKVRELELAIEQKPSARATYLQLAQVYVDGKRRDLAAQVVERCLALDPTSGFLKHRLAQIKGEVAAPPPPTRAGAPPAPAAPPRTNRAPTVAFQPVVRAPSAPVRNYMGESSKKRKLAIAGGLAALALAFLVKMWLFPSTRCLVTGDFRAFAPQWSPTGKHLAFLIGDDASSRIAVYDLAKGDYRPIGPASAWDARGFSWSPDGTKLAYSGPGGEGDWREAVFVADAAGGQPRRIASGTSPAWGPDGQTLIMVCTPETPSFSASDSDEGYAAPSYAARDWASRYCRVNVDSGQVQRMMLEPQYGGSLSTLHEAVVYDQSPEGAVEEAAGAAAATAGAEFEQFVDNVAAGRATNVAEGARDLSREVEAKKYGERRRAALTTERLPFAADVFLVGIGGGAPRAVTSDRQSAFPSWTPDGERIVFATNGASGLEFCAMKPDGTERQTVLAGIKGVDPLTVTLSPDGRQVFFVATVPGDEALAKIMTGESPADLHVAPVGSKEVRRLANKHAFKQRYAVSPDGQRIVYEVLQDVKMIGGAAKSELWLMRR